MNQILGEVIGEVSCRGEVEPSRNCQSLFITDDIGVTGDESSCPPSNLDFDAIVASYQW